MPEQAFLYTVLMQSVHHLPADEIHPDGREMQENRNGRARASCLCFRPAQSGGGIQAQP